MKLVVMGQRKTGKSTSFYLGFILLCHLIFFYVKKVKNLVHFDETYEDDHIIIIFLTNT